ncbi:hypothetical protein [Halostella sp. PRR32]|uniref:hypothetical protein n=1 Tax=Halostella sp. PRR32 TaxID=3098147 RepID=UPI002B1CE482|nr:hypothetical protein [Halostella sp. PRR32]
MAENIMQRLRGSGWQPGGFALRDFDFEGPNTTGEESVVADLQAERPVALRDDKDADLKLVIPAWESFSTDGTGGNTETFNLSNDIIDSPSTVSFLLYEEGSLVDADSVDYANNSFTYTDDGTNNTLDVFYVPRTPADVRLKKVISDGTTSIGQDVYEENTAILHSRDQAEQPTEVDVSSSELERYIPRKSNLQLIVNADYTVRFEAPERTNGVPKATNAILSVPKFQTESNVPGLQQAVKADAAGLNQGRGR